MKDARGNEINIGDKCKYIFGMPGPDITTVVIENINQDGTVHCFDILFKIHVNVKPESLYKMSFTT